MGTRSLTIVYEAASEDEIMVMYRQMDGYISGHGHELAKFLVKGKLINGIGVGDLANFNGMGCLAAQVVAHFKDGVGDIYLYPSETRDVGEEYRYTVRSRPAPDGTEQLEIAAFRGYGDSFEMIFRGSPAELLQYEEVDA